MKAKNFFISDIWGVGKQLSKLYIKNGIDTAYKTEEYVINKVGKKVQMF